MSAIADVRTLVVGAGMRNWVLVRIETDDGLVGWGEATTEWRTRSVVAAVDDLAPLLLGQDAMRTEHLWQSMHRGQFWKGGLVSTSALSGIDQALHDLKAKALGVPLYQLLGGRVRDRVRLYDHLGGGDPAFVYGPNDPGRFAEAARRSVDEGYGAVKILACPTSGPLLEGATLRGAVAATEAVRSAVGDDVEVMIDLHGRTTPAAAITFTRAVEDLRPWFIEEPCQPESVTAMARIAAATPIPIATGERLVGRVAFRELLDAGAASVVQPDVCHCGGVSELLRIAALAESYQVPVAPHNPLGPLATAVNLHAMIATPNFLIQEVMRADVAWRDAIFDVPFRIEGGYAMLEDRPGIGVEIDEDAAAAHPYVPERQIGAVLPDGSIADW